MDVKNELKYGFWMAFALFLWWVFEYISGIQGEHIEYLNESVLISNFVITAAGIFMVMVAKKKVTDPKELSYSTLAISGGITVLAAGILVLALSSIFYHFVNANWTTFATEMNINEFASHLEGEALEKKREMYMAMFAPGSMGMQNFSRISMIGFFALFIEALLVLKLPIGAKS